jgi:hypothetical protein
MSSAGSSLGRWRLELLLCLDREKAGASKVFRKFLTIDSTASSSDCKNSFGKTIGAPKTDSARESPAFSLG